ncbi:MAG: hypothetical protein V1748_03480 [Actinomycetota bacterium]
MLLPVEVNAAAREAASIVRRFAGQLPGLLEKVAAAANMLL